MNTNTTSSKGPWLQLNERRAARAGILLLLLLLALPAVVEAQFTYTTNNGTITITGYTGQGGAVTIPDTINGLPVTSIGTNAFYACTNLNSVTIPNSVTSIRVAAFYYCISLTSVTIPNSVTSIGDEAFGYCSRLTSVTIPDSVTSIGSFVFNSCTGLTSITIPYSVTSIGDYAFWDCTSLTSITVDTLNSAYSSVDGVLFNKTQTTLVQYPAGIAATSYTIPNGVTSIGNWAFGYCSSLTDLTIPNSVTSIRAYAFEVCTSLTSVTIGSGVTSIENLAFYSCTSLTALHFRGNAPSLGGSEVFQGDNHATVYYLPGTTGWGATFGGLPTALWQPPPPGAWTLTATTITPTGATLNGTVNPSGSLTAAWFQWGTTTNYGNLTAATGMGSGANALPLSAPLVGLTPGVTYHYRVAATNSNGAGYGSDQSFTTLGPPLVSTLPATGLSTNSATLNGSVNADGYPTTAWFQWGTTIQYGNLTAATGMGSGTNALSLSAPLAGLTPGVTYHFRVAATNDFGLIYGSDQSFTTLGLPLVSTLPATDISANSATLNGTVNPNGSLTAAWFQWGTTTTYGNVTPVSGMGSGTNALALSAPVAGLVPGTTYHFRAAATNIAGVVYGSDRSFIVAGAGGMVTNCTEADLRAAMAGGGTVTLVCDGTITLAGTITIAADTVLDASGHQITISGNGAMRVFYVNSNVNFSVISLTVANGFCNDRGAGILNDGGMVNLIGVTLTGNRVANSYDGGTGRGGAICNLGQLTVRTSSFLTNQASGGRGYDGCCIWASPGGWGGSGLGGALDNEGTASIASSTFVGNLAYGGQGGAGAMGDHAGGKGGAGGAGGLAVGAVNNQGSIDLVNCTFASNGAYGGVGGTGGEGGYYMFGGGPGGVGGDGGAGGSAYSCIHGEAGITNCAVAWNRAQAGPGGSGGPGGPGLPYGTYPDGPPGINGPDGTAADGLSGGPVAQAPFFYTTNNGSITITGYTGPGGALAIPETINGLPVTSIEGAFVNCASLTSVTIPNSVTSIGTAAFMGCAGLTNVTIPNSVKNIGDDAFDDCTSLTDVVIPSSVTNMGYEAFQYCSSLTALYFQGNAPSLGYGVFYGDNNATVYYLPGTTGWGSTFGGLPTVLWQPPPPKAWTLSASTITPTGATLNGTVNPSGSLTAAWFQWGTTTNYGNLTAATGMGSGTNALPLSAPLVGLTPGVTYHYRVAATNSNGTGYSSDGSFTTLGPPEVWTLSAAAVTATNAMLNGTVNPNGYPTTAWFQWGTTTSYGNLTAATDLGSGTSDLPLSVALTGLTPNVTYHLRIAATNDYGLAYGSDQSFTTQPQSGGAGWTLNGGATMTGNTIALTVGAGDTSRSAFLNNKQDVTAFNIVFYYQDVSGAGSADGVTFCIQNDPRGPTALGGGSGGSSLGYENITPSVALAMNIYAPNGRGVALFQNGAVTYGYASLLPDVDIGGNTNIIQVNVDYNGTVMTMTFKDTVTGGIASTNWTVNIPSVVGGSTAYVGFTGADGGVASIQTISWGGWTPTILIPPRTQTAEAGSAVGLSVHASGVLPLSYLWYLNHTNLISCSTNCQLALTNIQFSQSGAYSVVVSNVLGAITSAPAMLNVIAAVERRPVPGVMLTGEAASLLSVDCADSLNPAPNWTTLVSISLTSTPQYWFDLTLPLPPQRFYRAWQVGTPGVRPSLELHMVPAITLTGSIGGSVRADAINQFGPTDAWFTLDTVTLTNTSQLYFDTSAWRQPPRLYRLVQVP